MPKRVLIEEFHVSVYVSSTLPDAQSTAIRRTLNSKRFCAGLKRTVRGVVRQHPSLSRVHVRISR